jgi:hypothetical protein
VVEWCDGYASKEKEIRSVWSGIMTCGSYIYGHWWVKRQRALQGYDGVEVCGNNVHFRIVMANGVVSGWSPTDGYWCWGLRFIVI